MKEIQLNRGMVALVNDEDYDYLTQWNWFAMKGRHTFYAMRNNIINGKNCGLYMHRVILDVINEKGIHIDHKDHNGLNNQRDNLRKCTNRENRFNMVHRIGGTSKYRGVDYISKWDRWRARVNKDKKTFDLGLFKTEQLAAEAYNNKANELYGEFANLNQV